MSSPPKTVTIIGGSLAGLFLANVLKSIPSITRIQIIERFQESQLQDLGAGIRIGQESIAAIQKYIGVPPEKYSLRTSHYRFVNRAGEIIVDRPGSGCVSTWGQLYRVLREAFDNDSPRCTYRHGYTLRNITKQARNNIEIECINEKGAAETFRADLVIGADGASSQTRAILAPSIERAAVGYACIRGVVYEDELTEASAALYRSSATFYWTDRGQLVSYAVPSNEAPADKARPWVNWVWYEHHTPEEMTKLLMDKSGRTHKFSLPAGGMSEAAIQAVHEAARECMPPAYAETIGKTTQPFVQIVTDSEVPETSFWEGKVLLVGDAVGGQRPHTASSFLQCAFHAVLTGKLLRGEVDIETWAKATQSYSSILVNGGKELGKICMSSLPPSERTPAYFQVFFKIQADLKAKWDEVIGDLDALP